MFIVIIAGTFLTIIAILLIILVLLQNPKDEGGNILAGNHAIKQLVGSAHTSHFLERVTYGFFIGLLMGTLLFAYLLNGYYTS